MGTNAQPQQQIGTQPDEEQEGPKEKEVIVFDPEDLASRMLKSEELNDEEGHLWCITFEGLDKEIIIADPSYADQKDMEEHIKHAKSDLAQNIRKLTNLEKDALVSDLEHQTNKETLELKNQKRTDEAEVLNNFFINHVRKTIISGKEAVDTEMCQLDVNLAAKMMLGGGKIVDPKYLALGNGKFCIQLKDTDTGTVIICDPGYENQEHFEECLKNAIKVLSRNLKQIMDESKNGLLADLQRSAEFEIFTLKSRERFAEASVVQDYFDRIVKVSIENSKKDKEEKTETEEEEESN